MAKKKNNKGKKKTGGATSTAAPTVTSSVPTPAPAPDVVVAEKAPAAVEPISTLPVAVESSLSILTDEQQTLIKLLCSKGQTHIFEPWASASNADKIALATQLVSLDKAYPSNGLSGYIENARDLLAKSKAGLNPLEGWTPSIPTGQAFTIGTDEYNQVEAVGMKELGAVGFVLVAGGLGERLGYGDIKVSCTLTTIVMIST
jgi:UDP-N-acetylglucosamine pyrophosphorylase